ncbi:MULTISPECIES: acryloyl-CoA reductase [unclassified Variovorax]|uniref:acrylyl-CoA reductase family protein n=1 Tax=unclassified Variovorax TaxID=663243 RepID=UPI00076D0325|nr:MULTISPECIES: acryloyl-CoA reductase [unclassified Variovorax]KWT97017.1 Alcohol dehydrogenase [Variovorax sp. WDL1]PNG58573.1 putative quinone oxidoreductase YhfP [Variovorax sp. B4]PNG61637.1 putative quinone oxidoreductase YhfP [Variovorax sp. B2]VTV12323.1 Putative quinone oxidoreductase YhfP [Variovorax sp. WDL1]
MNTFKAFRVHTIDGKPVCRFERLTLDDLDPGPVLIRTAFSAITYKDAMAARGVGRNVRTDRPCVTGVDMSGVVVSSADPRFREGDQVAVTNYKLGTEQDGGYAEYTRVPGDWIVPLPEGLSLYEAMALGTSGLTAALAVDRLEKAGLTPDAGPVAVTGATGGVGSLAVDMFARRGFEVVAISGKREQEGFLRAIGASRVMPRDELLADKSAMASGAPFAGALDNVGGGMLDRLMAQMRPHGKIAVAGMVGVELHATVLPFVLRSVDILGINVSRQLQMPERQRLWQRMATDLKPRHLAEIARPIPFEDLDKTMDSFFNVSTVGRVVVEVGPRAG